MNCFDVRLWQCSAVHRAVARSLSLGGAGAHGERGTRAYNGGLGAEPPAGSRGRAPAGGSGGEAPLKLKAFLPAFPMS